jgi:hypothetical protein
MARKKGLNTKTIVVTNPDNGDEFELFVTFEIIDNELIEDDDVYFDIDDNVDIKSYESTCEEEIPEWVNEDMVYDSIIEELEIEEGGDFMDDEEEDEDFFDDYEKDFNDDLMEDEE